MPTQLSLSKTLTSTSNLQRKTTTTHLIIGRSSKTPLVNLDGVRNHDFTDELTSPYYRGLTDSSLVIGNPNRVLSGSTPGRESQASSSSSNFLSLKEWSTSCFNWSKNKGLESNYKSNPNPVSSDPTNMSKDCSCMEKLKEKGEDPVGDDKIRLVDNKDIIMEPLRERLSEPVNHELPKFILPSKPFINNPGIFERNTEVNYEREVFTWANKYRPRVLDDFICNRDKALQLKMMLSDGVCREHFILEGPPGVGKRTMIRAMLRESFGDEVLEVEEEYKVFNLKGETVRSIPIKVKKSRLHVEVNVSEMKGYEKQIIVQLIKESRNKRSRKSLPSTTVPDHNYKGITLYLADKLSTDALQYIRWVVEKSEGRKKIFFCCSDASKLQPVKDLCTVVPLSPPSKHEIVEVLEFIAKQEGIELPHQLAQKIANKSKNNFRQAIRSFEASQKKNYPFKEDQELLSGWEEDIANIAKMIVQEQSPKQLYLLRGSLQNLREHDVSPEYIFKSLVQELKKHVDEELHHQIESLSIDYNRHDKNSYESDRGHSDPIRKNVQRFLRIEEFIAKFMSFYKGQKNKKSTQAT